MIHNFKSNIGRENREIESETGNSERSHIVRLLGRFILSNEVRLGSVGLG